MNKAVFIIIQIIFFSGNIFAQKQEVQKYLQEMLNTIKAAKSYKYDFKTTQRIENKLIVSNFKVKLNVDPFKIYLFKKEGGQEILFVQNENGNEALVNPNGFPFINLSLDPYGSVLRKDSHHTIFESNFFYLGSIIDYSIKSMGADIYKYTTYNGELKFNNVLCHQLVLDYELFAYKKYTVKEKETLITIAKRLNLSEYMIMEKNKLDDYDDVKAGDVIKIPNLYCKKIVLYIDKINKLPVYVGIYDELGLFESFEYANMQLNPVFKSDEFSAKYKEYHF